MKVKETFIKTELVTKDFYPDYRLRREIDKNSTITIEISYPDFEWLYRNLQRLAILGDSYYEIKKAVRVADEMKEITDKLEQDTNKAIEMRREKIREEQKTALA